MATTATTMVHVKVNAKTKHEAQKVAKRLGVSLSLVAEQAFRDFAAGKRLVVEEPLIPTPYLAKILREAEKNKNNPKYWSPAFTTAADASAYLRKMVQK